MASRADRAKQFLSFDTLKGFQEALREKEIEREEKRELSEESLLELENQFNKIEKGINVTIKYYNNKKYVKITGTVTNINYIKKKIQINNQNINMCDIVDIYL